MTDVNQNEGGKISFLQVRIPETLKEQFHTACRRNKTTIQDEVNNYVVARITEMENAPVQYRKADRKLRDSFVIMARVPRERFKCFKKLSKEHGYSITEQLVEFIEKRTAELNEKFQQRRAQEGLQPIIENVL